MASRKSETQRASNYRRRVREGEKLSKDESDWLAQYDATKKKPGRPTGSKNAAPAGPLPTKIVTDESDDDAPEVDEVEDDLPAPTPPPTPPRLPSPPKIILEDSAPKGRANSGDWRQKYKQGNSESGAKTGREQTCLVVSSYWLGALASMTDAMKEAGIDPIVDPQTLSGSIVLTVDELLPDHVELTPRMHAVGGTSALLVQRFLRREGIAKAQEKKKERETFNEWKEHRKDPVVETPPPPPEPDVQNEDIRSANAARDGLDKNAPPQTNGIHVETPAKKQGRELDEEGVW